MDPFQGLAPHDLLGKTLHFVIQDDDVVGVPANRPAQMKEEFIKELEKGREFIGH